MCALRTHNQWAASHNLCPTLLDGFQGRKAWKPRPQRIANIVDSKHVLCNRPLVYSADVWHIRRQAHISPSFADEDARGGVAVTSFAREFVLRQTPADARQQAYLAAALVREQRGEYTLVASHYIAANQPTIAVRLWAPHRVAERARGNGPLALSQFRNVLTAHR